MRGLLASKSAMLYLVVWRKTNVSGTGTISGCIVKGGKSFLIEIFRVPENRFCCYTSF